MVKLARISLEKLGITVSLVRIAILLTIYCFKKEHFKVILRTQCRPKVLRHIMIFSFLYKAIKILL